MVQVLVVVEDFFACRCKGLWCDHAVALIDDAEYGNNCGMWTSNMWCALREF